MTPDREQQLRTMAADLPLDWYRSNTGAFTGEDKGSYRPLVEAAHVVADESRATLHRWVDAARRAGLSWAEVGEVIGISKQAAQQRFGGDRDDLPTSPDAIVVKLGATAFNEMAMLAREGEIGRELIATGALRLIFRQTDRTWRYLRTVGPIDPVRASKEGWEPVSTWFVFHYHKRPA